MPSDLQQRPASWRDRFDHAPGLLRPNRVRTGAIFAAFSLIFCWAIYTRPSVPFLAKSGTKLTAEFAYASNLYPGRTPVRVNGVDVGLVKKVERGEGGRGVIVEMQIDDGRGVHLHRDARADIRWRTLLGRNMYIDLDEGSRSAPKLAARFIPKRRTSNQVELDTTLEVLDSDGRHALKTLMGEFEQGFSDAQAVQRTLDNVAPAMRPLGRAMKAMRGTEPGQDLPRLIAGTSRAARALARDEAALAGLIDHGNVALGVTAARRADLASTLRTAPVALRETRTSLTRLVGTLDELDPLATRLEPGVRKLAGSALRTQRTLAAALPLLRDLRPMLGDLRPAVTDLGRASRAGAPAFGPLTKVMERSESTFVPWLNSREKESGRVIHQAIGPAVASASSVLAYGDKHQSLANFEANVGESAPAGFSPCKTYLADPTVKLEQKIQCELMARSLVAVFQGQKLEDVQLRKSAVPERTLKSYLTGNKRLKFGAKR